MTTESSDLRATLAKLHEELDDTREVNPALQSDLRDTVREIESVLERIDDGSDPSLPERLTELARRFEGSHPRIAEIVNRVVLGLTELGI